MAERLNNYRAFIERNTDLLARVTQADKLLREAELAGDFLSPLIESFMSTLNLDTVPGPLKPEMRERTEMLVYYGLFTHCLLFGSHNRLTFQNVDRSDLYNRWLVASLTANSTLRSYDRDNAEYPSKIFEAFYRNELEPVQRSLGLGWWRRQVKNRGRFKNFFASGVLLGMFYDMETAKAAKPEGMGRS
ncbi:MAG: hypothetical protein ACRD2L_03645 [Terriglobia bacterium]